MKKFDIPKKNILTPQEEYENFMGSASTDNSQREIDIEKLQPYPNQPFKPYSDEKLQELAEDIKINGLLSPIIVRAMEDGKYQILAGHNRVSAYKLLEHTTISAVVKDIDDNQAQLIMVNSNLNQRHELLPSELAFAYKIQLEAVKQQGKRTDLTSCHSGTKLASAQVAENNNESKRTIHRYIRLTKLIKPLLLMVDDGGLNFLAGVNLSYLSLEQQEIVFEYIKKNENNVTKSQSEKIKGMKEITEEALDAVFLKKQREKVTAIKIPSSIILKYFPNAQSEDEIIKLLEEALRLLSDQ